MARNSEKAQSMLYRFREQQAAERGLIDTGMMRRPKNITQVTSIPVCEKWRGQVIRQISRAVIKIQDRIPLAVSAGLTVIASLSDYQIRDLNDEINRMMKEKYVWEVQLRNLGGPNYGVGMNGKVIDDDGKEVPGQRGYRYYGRARELPGVKELLEATKPPPSTKKLRSELQKNVDADYYGYRDEDDGLLVEYEEMQEEIAMASTIKDETGEPPEGWTSIGDVSGIPTQAEVEAWLVDRRKQRLLERYGM